jgi:hypothetical protein
MGARSRVVVSGTVTRRKVAVSITDDVIEFSSSRNPCNVPGTGSASNRNEYQESS